MFVFVCVHAHVFVRVMNIICFVRLQEQRTGPILDDELEQKDCTGVSEPSE